MRWAVLSDIHGNLSALDAVLQHILSKKVDHLIFSGDVVGHGPSSEACVQRIYKDERLYASIKGNNDKAIHTDALANKPQGDSKVTLEWAKNEISNESLKWLTTLSEKPVICNDLITVIHGTVNNPVGDSSYLYDNDFNIIESVLSLKTPICVFGHTHRPVVYKAVPKSPMFGFDIIVPDKLGNSDKNSIEEYIYQYQDDIDNGKRILVCAGSIGQPRDDDWRASYMIIDDEKRLFSFYRLPYDIDQTLHVLDSLLEKYPQDEKTIKRTKDRLILGK